MAEASAVIPIENPFEAQEKAKLRKVLTWIGGTLTASTIATLDVLVLKKPLGTTAEIIVGLAFVWVTVGIAIVAFRIGKWGPNIGPRRRQRDLRPVVLDGG
jgi:hypothetical protein